MPAQLQDAPSSSNITVEVWPVQLSLHCKILPEALGIAHAQFREAAQKAVRWVHLEAKQPALKVVRDAAQAAPLLPSIDQSLLHIWCALEALFPTVSTEVSFRLALYLAQLLSPTHTREATFKRARKEYHVRSKVAHGSHRGVSHDEWVAAWRLLCDAGNAIIDRGKLPSENDLLHELLTSEEGRVMANEAMEPPR